MKTSAERRAAARGWLAICRWATSQWARETAHALVTDGNANHRQECIAAYEEVADELRRLPALAPALDKLAEAQSAYAKAAADGEPGLVQEAQDDHVRAVQEVLDAWFEKEGG